jgi:hypothetical protein
MEDVLTLSLRDGASVEFIRRRAEREHRSPESVVEELVLRAKALADADAQPVTLAVAPELAGVEARLLRDDDECDEEFERRRQSFAALTSLA